MIEDKELLNELNELENSIKEQGLIDAFRPDWADCPNQGLEVGCDYVYYFDEEICMRGHVLYNDGVTAILKVINRFEECCFHSPLSSSRQVLMTSSSGSLKNNNSSVSKSKQKYSDRRVASGSIKAK